MYRPGDKIRVWSIPSMGVFSLKKFRRWCNRSAYLKLEKSGADEAGNL